MKSFIERLAEEIADCRVRDAKTRALIGRAVADTLAVAAAGFLEPVAIATSRAYGGDGPMAWNGGRCDSRESAILLNAIASHALDYDDCFLASLIHPSTVILPAIFRGDGSDDGDSIIDAFGAGLLAGRVVAERLGAGHYQRGWHGTGTVGAFAAAGAAARLNGLDPAPIRSAMALIAAQAGGLHINFGTMAKPAQAGFAAANGYRAVRMAEAGVAANPDIFGPRGFADIYGGGDAVTSPGADIFRVRADRIAVKLYPSCYQTHRLIGLALDARAALGPTIFLKPDTQIILRVPAGSIGSLLYPFAKTGNEGKFSPRFPVVVALADGPPTIAHFSDEVTRRADIVSIGKRLEILEDRAQQANGDMEFGTATLEIRSAGRERGMFERRFLPGSPEDPPSADALAVKFRDCAQRFGETCGKPFPAFAAAMKIAETRRWLEPLTDARRPQALPA
jgi:2-methylcitrate dehydratase PrpD